MFYNVGYCENLVDVSKIKKPNLPLVWNGLFTLILESFTERETRSDCASKLFMIIIYGAYFGVHIDYGIVLWAQLVQSTLSLIRHNKISCARFWTIVVQRASDRLGILVIEGSSMANIQIFHTMHIFLSDTS